MYQSPFKYGSGKIICRETVWSNFDETKPLRGGKHLILAGEEAGDIPVLRMHGVPERNIVVVDIIAEFLHRIGRHWGGVTLCRGDVFEVVIRNFKNQFDSMYLDWCATISASSIKRSVITACEGLKPDGLFACTFFACRELDSKLAYGNNKTLPGFMSRAAMLSDNFFETSRAYTGNQALVPRMFSYYINESNHPMVVYIGQLITTKTRGQGS